MADVIALGGIVPGFIIMFGIFFLPPGILALCAGAGVMMRKPWGHMLTYVVAIIAITLGLIWAIGSDQDLPHIAVGAAQILYGILAVVVLTVNCAEFLPADPEFHAPHVGVVGRLAAGHPKPTSSSALGIRPRRFFA